LQLYWVIAEGVDQAIPKRFCKGSGKIGLKASLKGCLTTAGETLLELRAKKPEKQREGR